MPGPPGGGERSHKRTSARRHGMAAANRTKPGPRRRELRVYWKVENDKQRGEDLDAEETEEKTRRRFLLTLYRVFNLESAICRKL